MTQFEFNPYYIVTMQNGVEWGFGPGWGVIWSDAGKSDTVFTAQAGTGIKYNLNARTFIGADARYQWTQSTQLAAGVAETLDNYRTNVKIGYRF
ncbi:MAG: outer membrane beta-barrel protein [Campylobacterales bacterium]|nr:outer membrane beta-barrel protein [Campylobacterales bacterium]